MIIEIINEKSFEKIRSLIKKAKSENKMPLIFSYNDDLTRKLAEKEKGIIIGISLKNRKDKLYQRDSGLDKATAKFCEKNNNTIGIPLEEFFNETNKKEKAKILARIKQNIKLSKKAKAKIIFLSSNNIKDKKNLFSLALILGMNTKTAKEASKVFKTLL